MKQEEQIAKLEKEIEDIKLRNKSVELDKAWETSGLRKLLIAVFTFLAISLYMWAINIDRPFLNAIVPTVGFMLSTLTFPYFRKLWEKNRT